MDSPPQSPRVPPQVQQFFSGPPVPHHAAALFATLAAAGVALAPAAVAAYRAAAAGAGVVNADAAASPFSSPPRLSAAFCAAPADPSHESLSTPPGVVPAAARPFHQGARAGTEAEQEGHGRGGGSAAQWRYEDAAMGGDEGVLVSRSSAEGGPQLLQQQEEGQSPRAGAGESDEQMAADDAAYAEAVANTGTVV